jgi:trehalose 6-phosphate phosphatase
MLACFLEEPPFVGRLPVFVGDDITDEDGFRYVNQRGGLSIRVGGAKISAARYRIADVSAVLVWLNDVAEKPEDTGP